MELKETHRCNISFLLWEFGLLSTNKQENHIVTNLRQSYSIQLSLLELEIWSRIRRYVCVCVCVGCSFIVTHRHQMNI
ncbi:hypothetical protein BD408DRAFT_415563 [Parasitella parasitica]|nr:hypothetical protein BD408DRAFT_415563 [Parasitella parasitica]